MSSIVDAKVPAVVGEIMPTEKTSDCHVGLSATGLPTRDPSFEISWEPEDPDNPQNWPVLYRSFIVGTVSFSTSCVVLCSTSYTSGVPGMQETFDGASRTVILLGLTTYLLGLALGCLILAPLSELYGRRPIYIVTTAIFALFVLPVALAPNLATVLTCRAFSGFFGSATIASGPGSINDVISPQHRALAFSLWGLGALNGPVLGPIIGGFVYQYLGWRWINWIVLICTGAFFVAFVLCKETYAPIILKSKRAKKQRDTGDARWWCRYDDETIGWELIQQNLTRPLSMAIFEPICICWNLYVGVVYAVLFLCFVGYPIVFQEHRNWSPGIAGLGYLGIGVGVVLAVSAEPLMRMIIQMHPKSLATGQVSQEAYVSPVCIGSILIPIGIPFGLGNGLVFIYSTNYLAGSYTVYAASALAGNSLVRYVFGGVLPLAGSQMYHRLGVDYAGTMLALLEVILIPIPFVFYRYGEKIRQRSHLIP